VCDSYPHVGFPVSAAILHTDGTGPRAPATYTASASAIARVAVPCSVVPLTNDRGVADHARCSGPQRQPALADVRAASCA
jgi:hypothetical protein